MNQSTHVLQFAGVEQRLINGGDILVLQQIFGLTDVNSKDPSEQLSEDEKLCVICISEEKNTVVMPCGHLCVCKACAIEIAKSRGPDCPVCRKKVLSFVPLNIENIKTIEEDFAKEADGIVEGE